MQDCMQQFPKVYNQVGDDKEGGVGSMGLDLGLDDGEIDEDEHAEYADGDEEEKQSSEVVKK
jgi:hypothetical protein